MTRRNASLAAALAGALLLPRAAAAVEPSARAATGQLPLVGDKEIFQPGTQPCTIPGDAASCFHTDHRDDFDRKFHPAQADLLLTRSGDLPVATDGANPPRLELVCSTCHGGYIDPRSGQNADYAPFDTWRGTMMAQAFRDPLARAAIAVANQGLTQAKIDFATGRYDDGPSGQTGRTAGDICIRCHSPVGWLEGNSIPADGSRIGGRQMDGVQCDFCHRAVNPVDFPRNTYAVPSNYNALTGLPSSVLAPQTFSGQTVPVLHNGNFIVNDSGRKIGPYTNPADLQQHPLDALESPPADAAANRAFITGAQLCAVCHNVTNPILRVPDGFPGAGQRVPVERTYTEWYFSNFGPKTKGNPNAPLDPADAGKSCQSCHMPAVDGYAADPSVNPEKVPLRRVAVDGGVAEHAFVGGNAWAQEMIPYFFPDQATLAPVFQSVEERARANLRSAASLAATLAGSRLRVEVTNLTGHKLPTGYPEGRRMWLHVVGYDSGGKRVYESGAYDGSTAELAHDPDLKLWAAELAIQKPGQPIRPSSHFILNNVVLKDDRIPPAGFDPSRASADATLVLRGPAVVAPADAERDCRGYADPNGPACLAFDFDGDGKSDGKDVVFYDLPPSAAKITVELWYQTASKEYVEFLSDPNQAGEYADRFTLGLRAAWQATGMSPPVEMARAAIP